uniref:Chromosome 4 open reading frame 19 n=1 Tax=Aquila chrysaetos chrysaetos TaxID=223781 RepID=A0A663DKG2_AQUCH
ISCECPFDLLYIFDPEEVQSPGCIHDVNSYEHNEQDSNKSKFKENSEIQEHKNELQKDELNRTENKNQVNSAKETLWNHGGSDFQEDGLVKHVAKLDVAANGGNSCAGVQSDASSAKLDLETGSQRKAACNEPYSIQDENSQSAEDSIFLKESAILEKQNNAIQLPDTDYPQNGNQTRNYVEKDSFSVNCAHSDQNTGPLAIQDQDPCVTPPSPTRESSIEPFKTDSACLSEDITGCITAVAVTKVAQAPPHPNHKDINGETEEEDAEVAAALAALEAATAGEDLEDDDEY